MTTRRPKLRTRLLIIALITLGVFVLVLAFTRPSAGRFLSAGVLLGAAAVIRFRAVRTDELSQADDGRVADCVERRCTDVAGGWSHWTASPSARV